jgi:PTH1 family peptidyl-tRNA hydrolase
MYLVVALGNPGRKYEQTRHNLGWQVVDHASTLRTAYWKEKFKGEFFKMEYEGNDFVFLKPMTYMNLSGESVRAAMDFFKVKVENILVLHDELDLPFGTISFKNGGGLAGNNGLKSINQHLGTQAFKRLRLGIGRPKFGDVSNHVLSDFSSEEAPLLDDYYAMASDALALYMKSGFERAANKFSKKSIIN